MAKLYRIYSLYDKTENTVGAFDSKSINIYYINFDFYSPGNQRFSDLHFRELQKFQKGVLI